MSILLSKYITLGIVVTTVSSFPPEQILFSFKIKVLYLAWDKNRIIEVGEAK